MTNYPSDTITLVTQLPHVPEALVPCGVPHYSYCSALLCTVDGDAVDSDGPLDPEGEDHHGNSKEAEPYSPDPSSVGEEKKSWQQKVGL